MGRPALTGIKPGAGPAAGLPHQVVGHLEGGIGVVRLDLGAGFLDLHHQRRVALGDLVGDHLGQQLGGFAQADDHQVAGDQVLAHLGRHVHALDLVVVGEVVGDVALTLALAVLLNHLHDLRHDRLLGGRGVALGVELAGPLGVLALDLEGRQARLVDALGAGPALVLLLLGFFLVDLLGLALVDQAGFQKLFLQGGHVCRSVNGFIRPG